MGQLILGNILRFIFFTLLQVVVIQYVNFGSWCNPQLYLISVLLLPFEIPRIIVLMICFIQGLAIDLFYDQQGLHSGAMVLLGFTRPYILNLIAPREGYDALMKPSTHYMGNTWFLSYAAVLVFVHHLFYFYIEIFRFSEFFSTLSRSFLSCIASVALIYLFQFLFYRKDRLSA